MPFFGCFEEHAVLVLLNKAGSLTVTAAYPFRMAIASIAAADLDGDGDLDLAVPHQSFIETDYGVTGMAFEVLLNAGEGSFTRGPTISVGLEPLGIFTGNLDGQGLPDIAVVSAESVSVILNRTVPAAPDGNRNGIPDRCEEARFRRGDADGDGQVDLSDAVSVLARLFLGGPAPPCEAAADANGDSRVDIADPIFTLFFLFGGGPKFPPPFPACGPGTADELLCGTLPGCA